MHTSSLTPRAEQPPQVKCHCDRNHSNQNCLCTPAAISIATTIHTCVLELLSLLLLLYLPVYSSCYLRRYHYTCLCAPAATSIATTTHACVLQLLPPSLPLHLPVCSSCYLCCYCYTCLCTPAAISVATSAPHLEVLLVTERNLQIY